MRPAAFVVVIGTTDISLIPGISVAGPTPEATHYTPALDVEYLLAGRPLTLDVVPTTPEGIPTPAVVTRALTAGLPRLVVDAGSRIRPRVPAVDLGGQPGRDFRRGPALEPEAARRILDGGRVLGRELGRLGAVYLAESIPGGTTTAMAILVALGYDAWGKTSSASPDNPRELKERVVREGLARLGGRPPEGPLEAAAELGDPVHLALAALALGVAEADGTPVLAGGTQMAAAAALYRALGGPMERLHVATTRWVAADGSADFLGLMEAVGVRNVHIANVDFSASRHGGLRAYERGAVKEGVGMGGALYYAQLRGMSNGEIVEAVDREYDLLVGKR